jgi:hypothetical protein
MRIIAIHHIDDASKFQATTQGGAEIPRQLELLISVPARDYSKAVCVWEAPSVGELQEFLDDALQGVARNELHEADAGATVGLPAG